MPVTRLRVLLSEASSLTAREHLTVLGTAGVRVEAMSSDPFALCRWSRWARQLHEGLAELDTEDLCRVNPAVDADDDVQIQVRDERQRGHVLARAGIGGEGPVAVQERGDVRHGFAFRGPGGLTRGARRAACG